MPPIKSVSARPVARHPAGDLRSEALHAPAVANGDPRALLPGPDGAAAEGDVRLRRVEAEGYDHVGMAFQRRGEYDPGQQQLAQPAEEGVPARCDRCGDRAAPEDGGLHGERGGGAGHERRVAGDSRFARCDQRRGERAVVEVSGQERLGVPGEPRDREAVEGASPGRQHLGAFHRSTRERPERAQGVGGHPRLECGQLLRGDHRHEADVLKLPVALHGAHGFRPHVELGGGGVGVF